MNKQIVVLFDIDHTLFNTASFVDKVYAKHADSLDREKFNQILEEIRVNRQEVLKDSGSIKLRILNELWDNAGFKNDFYEESFEVLEKISKVAVIGILSQGEGKFQRKKIELVSHLFEEEHINITLDKYKSMPEVIEKYKSYKVIIIDDVQMFLYAAKKLNADVMTVWIKRDNYFEPNFINQKIIDSFIPDATITNLRQLVSIVERMGK